MLSNIDTILVTGGAGFVGSALLRLLLVETNASRIVVVDNLSNGRLEHVPKSPRITLRCVDLTEPKTVESLIGNVRPEVVFHLAALHFIPYCNAHPIDCINVNVIGTQGLLEACRKFVPAKIVLVSTAAVYPIGDGPFSEEGPVGPTDVYGLSKWVNEKQLELFATQTEAFCSVARLFNVYGPRETNPHVIPEILAQLVAGKDSITLGNIKPKRDYIHAEDVANALLVMAEKNTSSFRIYNVGTGREHSVEEILIYLRKVTGKKFSVTSDSDRIRKSDRMHLVADPSRLCGELGWMPAYDIESGLTALWDYELQRIIHGEGE